MISINEKIEQFKRDCGSYNHYIKMIVDCDERLECIAEKLKGVRSVSPKGVVYENCGDPYKEMKNDYLTEEEEVIKEKERYEYSNNNVDKILIMISDPLDRSMIRDRLIEKRYYKTIFNRYGYNDISAVDKRIESVLRNIFKSII